MSLQRSSRSCSALVIACLIACVAPSVARQARAQAAAPVVARRVVEVHVAGGGSEAASLDDTIRELLGRLTLVMESQTESNIDPEDARFRSTERPSLLARVGVDLRSPDIALVTIVDGRSGDVTLRRTVRREGSAAVFREELAHVVQSALEPLRLADQDRVAPVSPPVPVPVPDQAPAPPPSPPAGVAPRSADTPPTREAPLASAESRSALALDLSTMAGAGSFAPGVGVVARAGGGAALVWRRGLRPSIGVAAHYVFPFDAGPEIALAHVAVTSIRGVAGLQVYGASAFSLDVAAGGGVDVLRVDPRSNVLPESRLGPATSRVDPIATAAVTGHLAVGAGTALSLVLALDVDLASRHWVIAADDHRSDALAPSRLRPLAMLGFTFTAAGDPRFASREPAR